ncbi:MAG: DUF4258 domain-containing protein [Candidatus Thermoplasmatota archaeon]|nr:DUF4258 domain-containing protein [Candidatus Thermoplasmatota archaeon]MCL5889494.1 DUF4258 domain-containing protein [Candidatus Thermoplasmatota archaeon]
MRERGISSPDIELALSKPDRITQSEKEKRAIKKIDDRALIVIFRETNGMIVVITAFVTSKMDKYLS